MLGLSKILRVNDKVREKTGNRLFAMVDLWIFRPCDKKYYYTSNSFHYSCPRLYTILFTAKIIVPEEG